MKKIKKNNLNKITLRGGPSDLHGKIYDFSGGEYILFPVIYENKSFIGIDKNGDPIYKDIFERKYKVSYELNIKSHKVEYYGDYIGEE